MTVIMSMPWSGLNPGAIGRVGDANIDRVDEPAFRGSGWIHPHFDYFHKYLREPWKIQVGECAHYPGDG